MVVIAISDFENIVITISVFVITFSVFVITISVYYNRGVITISLLRWSSLLIFDLFLTWLMLLLLMHGLWC